LTGMEDFQQRLRDIEQDRIGIGVNKKHIDRLKEERDLIREIVKEQERRSKLSDRSIRTDAFEIPAKSVLSQEQQAKARAEALKLRADIEQSMQREMELLRQARGRFGLDILGDP